MGCWLLNPHHSIWAFLIGDDKQDFEQAFHMLQDSAATMA